TLAAAPVNPLDLAFVHKWLKPGQYMTTDQIRPGMVGYGLTVFQGTKVERFNVKVIGVVKKVLNGRDAILVRMSGGAIGQSNVIKGMSGSPVYIDGKLVGAISFGYDFAKEPIAGITPIVDMLDALAQGSDKPGPLARATTQSWVGDWSGRTQTSSGAPRMVPLMSPVALVGFSSRAEEFLREHLGRFGMTVSSGAAGGMDPTLASGSGAAVQPGSALSVLLTTGDFYSVATGTTTARFGNQILAFGHPFLQAGTVEFPLATAYIHEILPSLFVSFKVASPINLAGAIVADRPWSVGAQLGRASKMIPATFNVVDQTRNVKRTFRCQVVDHPDLTPELLASTAISAIDATHQSSGPYVARVESRIEAEGIEAIERVDRFSTNFSPPALSDSGAKFRFVADPVGSFLLRTTAQITNNDFQKASIKNVRLDITLKDGHETATIEKVYLDRPFAAPGETVNVNCVLKPYDREARVETIPLTIPRDAPDGNLLISVCGGGDLNAVKKRMGLVDPTPETLQQVAAKIKEQARGDAVVMLAALPQTSLLVKGVKLVNPPAHWHRVFYSNRHTKGPPLVKGEIRVSRVTDWLIDGSHILTVEVRSPEKVAARSAPYTVPASGTDEGIITTEQARKAIEASRKQQPAAKSGQESEAPGAEGKEGAASPLSPLTSKEYPHMRQALVWRQDSEADFRAGKTDGTTVDSWGRMRPGFDELAARYIPSVMQIWSGVYSGGYFWFATTNEIWRWKGDASAPEAVAKLEGAVAVPAMAADSKGTVYAASVPGGKIWTVGGDKPQLVGRTAEPIVTSLCVDADDNLFIGVAGTGKVYKLDSARHQTMFFDSRQAHVLCLFYCLPEGKLYVGTGEKGAVYRLDATGKSEAVYQCSDHLVTGVARTKKGDLYVASAGQGRLVRVLPSGEAQALASSEAFYTLYYDRATDSVYSGDAEGDITQAAIDPLSGQPYFVPVCHTEQEAVLVLASDGQQHLYAATSNLGTVRCFAGSASPRALYSSVVRDAGRLCRWSRLRIYGAFNEPNELLAARIKVETRTGDTSQPDDTWSAWQEARFDNQSFAVASPPARYLQYRLTWIDPQKFERAAVVGRVEATYLPRNSAPKFNSLSVKAGSVLAKKQTVTVSGTDPDGDNLVLSIDVSRDNGQTWTPLAGDLRSKKPAKPAGKPAERESQSTDDDGASGKKDWEKSGAEGESQEAPGGVTLSGGVQHDADSSEPEVQDKGADDRSTRS
ncbi:MAG TPA: SpoIVB peptidase S55 domain-containing protein, partial [Candidatus Obscuribacterales bacterium]